MNAILDLSYLEAYHTFSAHWWQEPPGRDGVVLGCWLVRLSVNGTTVTANGNDLGAAITEAMRQLPPIATDAAASTPRG